MQTAPQVLSLEQDSSEIDTTLIEFAHNLARTHTPSPQSLSAVDGARAPRISLKIIQFQEKNLLGDLHRWDLALRKANALFKSHSAKDAPVSRAGEWMLDNYYFVKQTLRQIEEDLPASFLEQLPKLSCTSQRSHSRVFALAQAWIAYNQSQIDISQTEAFILSYQQVTPLTIGELWALPVMLRIGILEKLVYAAAELTGMEKPQGLSGSLDPSEVGLFLEPDLPGKLASLALPDEIIVANCFLSLRLLAAADWKIFFEKTSHVDQILCKDPAGIYTDMDFETRNGYRSIVEELGRHSPFSEEQVATRAVEFAREARESDPGRQSHVGYYLRDAGRKTLEVSLGYRPEFRVRLQRALLAAPTATYLISIAIFSVLFLLILIAYASWAGGSPAQLILAGLLGFGLAVEMAITVVQWNVTHNIKPQSLPRMDFSDGIPIGNRTMVVVPTLLGSADELSHLLLSLELYYLSNPDRMLTYALLTDFRDAPREIMPEDELLLALASAGIKELNRKYSSALPFYLFHRQRQWNPSEGAWMGWERKRGKLADFNRLLLNLGETSYTTQVGEAEILNSIKYVITLDADTSLPQGSAALLVATLAHPLNHALFSQDGRSVVAGYTVLQPRVDIKPTSANRSFFSQIFAGNAGFDMYSFAVSDVYQDLFGEGSYVGKGIYDVVAFERSLAGQVRQNTLLSHDLFEGIYGRAALVTDIVLYEEYPTSYLVYIRRLRRWIRGDWQLLPWLFPLVRTQSGLEPNRLSIINLWKIFDNLRRSLIPPTLVAMLAAGWLFLPGSPLIWTLLVLVPAAMPIAVQTFRQAQHNHGRLTLKQILKPARLPLTRWLFANLFLPYEAMLMLEAIRTTLARLLIGRRHLLEWTTAANSARSVSLRPNSETWLEMAGGLFITILLGISIAVLNPAALWVALPLLVAWLSAPQIAFFISQPITRTTKPLPEAQHRQVLRLARRTWAFFEQFAGPDDHWLPPDHFQESPLGSVAHYTTPTNIGLFFVSTLSAYDLGYLGLSELAVRLKSTFETLGKLEHYRGHLLNWYDSQKLEALPPRYISTVDSGNLAACLITLKQGSLALKNAPVLGNKQWQGLLVILDILAETLQNLGSSPGISLDKNKINPFEIELTSIYTRLSDVQDQPSEWKKTLAWLAGEGWESVSRQLIQLLESHPNLQSETLTELQLYLDLMQHQLHDMLRSLDLFAPWLGRGLVPGLGRDGLVPGSGQGWIIAGLEKGVDSSPLQTPAGQAFRDSLPSVLPTLIEASAVYDRIQVALLQFSSQVNDDAGQMWCQALDADLSLARTAALTLLDNFQDLAEQAGNAVNGMDFHFLYDDRRQVFHIGYNATTEQLDPSFYDLLASEARIASLIAIAKTDVPQSHWQHLGRPVTRVNGKQVLLSWSGTMFEYLMPTLFIRNYAGTFLADSCYAALDAQINYGQENHVPWGISESGYYAFDLNMNYQYRAFGVPDLGYKRDLFDDLVITPYASLLGLSLQPQAVLANVARLKKLNMLGRFGFCEALDFTKSRLPVGQTQATVQSYMAHHQGMILVAACNYLSDDIMVKRFHADERIQSVELLLQEKIPQNSPIEFPHNDEPVIVDEGVRAVESAPWKVLVDSPTPQVHVLAQGDTSLMITNTGGGFSQWREFALTRWQADTSLDGWGTWIYIQDRDNGALWSATCQPLGKLTEQQEVMFYPHKVEFFRSENGISLTTGITVSIDEVEIRRVNLLNESDRPRRLKLTSYGEVVLAEQSVDRRHPAFNKLFSEYLPEKNALIFQRRSRAADEKPVVLIHAVLIEAGRKITGEFESNRARFLGRSRTVWSPLALEPVQAPQDIEAGAAGGTLDPIFSLAQEIDLAPHAKTRVTFLTLAAPTRVEALDKLSHYQTGQAIHRAFDDTRASSERQLLEAGLNAYAVENIQHLLSALLYSCGALRAAPHILAQNLKGQTGLWAFGISGDYPILLVNVRDGDSVLLAEALQAFIYWRSHRTSVNLVIMNDQDTGYALDLQNAIQHQIRSLGAEGSLNQRDGIFILRADQLQEADRILLQTVAGAILDENGGALAEHVQRLTEQPTRLPGFTPSLSSGRSSEMTPQLQIPDNLLMENGLGGFSPDGKEYIIHLRSSPGSSTGQAGQHTPHPWVNVIANPQFGFLVSEVGSGSTWAGNSGENRLTPWRNDPVTDLPGEALYLRDEETGLVWSPTPLPCGLDTLHLIRHGAGYSIFESQSEGLNQRLRMFAAPDAPVKIVHLRLQNLWECPRRITVTYYAEWVLGTTRETQQAHIIPEFASGQHALLAVNHFNSEFGERVAFLAANKKPHGVTADWKEFLGRLGSLSSPAALGRIGLASAVNAGLDPCAVIQLHVDLAPGAAEEVFFLLGQGANRADSLALITELQQPGQVEATWLAVNQQWDGILDAVTVETPDSAMNLMLNRWLLYQTLSCRLWGRTGLYQSSGAFGFRDQLQDVLALLQTRPDITRAQILEAARHQFEAGDVLHWWNPPVGRGVRTRFSDDLLWLPFVTSLYVSATGDTSILKENIQFLRGETLKPAEMERYAQFETTAEGFSLYEHCRRALEKGATVGAHGLPLMGAGDWNDGMNRVGIRGRGESIWLGWFLYATLNKFAALAESMGADPAPYLQKAKMYAEALEANAWDGEWYMRAFYDDGSRLGSRENNECQIDSIAQSWAVLSGAANPQRAAKAMESLDRLLVKQAEQLILLFTPPFDITERDPGYIKGYLPGVRENGGQYTHAAIWAVWAFARLGQGERAMQLFNLLNPISHADTPEKVTHYKVEPYVIAADIYSVAPYIGSGGWTWYTGSSGWMYRLGLEAILGITRVGNALQIKPCIPHTWPGFKVDYRFGTSHYLIEVVQLSAMRAGENLDIADRGGLQLTLDGNPVPGNLVPLSDDGRQHQVKALMYSTQPEGLYDDPIHEIT